MAEWTVYGAYGTEKKFKTKKAAQRYAKSDLTGRVVIKTKKGWRHDSARHSLARKGIRTTIRVLDPKGWYNFGWIKYKGYLIKEKRNGKFIIKGHEEQGEFDDPADAKDILDELITRYGKTYGKI